MNTFKAENKGNTKFIAHRGLSGIEPENTNAAFIAAGNRSFYGIETDIYKTIDGKYVIMHDANTARMTGETFLIYETPFDKLRELTIFEKDGKKGRIDLHIPTFEEYLAICTKYEKVSVIELKLDFPIEDIKEIVDIVESFNQFENSIFISFHHEAILRLKEFRPDAKCQFLYNWAVSDEEFEIMKEKGIGIDICYVLLDETLAKKAHENNVELNVWGVNYLDQYETYRAMNVEYITTDIIE